MNEKEKQTIDNSAITHKAMGYLEALCDLTKLQTQQIIEMYVHAFEAIIGIELEFWVGDMRVEDLKAKRPTQPVDLAQFSDTYFFSLYNMRVVVDNFSYWIEKYETLENLQNEILDWHDYAVAQAEKNETHINLFNWLNGCPRDAEMSKKNLAAHGEDADEKKGGD